MAAAILTPMGAILLAVSIAIVLIAVLWRLPPRAWQFAIAGLWLLGQLMIWWMANDHENGMPWGLVTTGLPLERAIFALLLCGPLAVGLWYIWKARR